MDSILTVTTPASTYDLVTIDRVKRELGVTNADSDAILTDLVHEESDTFASMVNRVLASETVSEAFKRWHHHCPALPLTRYPVTAIASVTEDSDAALDPSLYEVDAVTGLLYRLGSDGGRHIHWTARQITIAYTGGYVPDALPKQIEKAVLTMVKNRWFARDRDPSVRSRSIVDVGQWDYWVGNMPGGSSLPPEVSSAVDEYRAIPI